MLRRKGCLAKATLRGPSSFHYFKVFASTGWYTLTHMMPSRTPRSVFGRSRTALRHVPRLCKAAPAEPSQRHNAASRTALSAIQSPQTDASVLDVPSLQPEQLFMRGKELLGGREVEERALRQCVELHERWQRREKGPILNKRWQGQAMEEAYDLCAKITAEYAKTFFLGTKLMPTEKARAIWAIYVWCRRTDELVDGPNASRITPAALDRWEERLENIWDGKPYDILDAALADTVQKFPVHIQPFRDMIGGMRIDLVKSRYKIFDELYEYMYRVAGTVGLASTAVMGISESYNGPLEPVYKAALSLGIANQLTNVLRDVGEDIDERDRIYLPTDELDRFGITEKEVLGGMFARTTGKIEDRWRAFMTYQIHRARAYFADAEAGVDYLNKDARWPVWSALILYRGILDRIEANEYDNFTKRAYVPKWQKSLALPAAFVRSQYAPNLAKYIQQAGNSKSA